MSQVSLQAEFHIRDLDDYKKFVQKNIQFFLPGNILLLSGKMGSGKTELVKAIVEVLHQKQNAKSPTFALHHHYQGTPPIEHWDLYRLQNEDELESSGFWDQMQDRMSFLIIEWPERIQLSWLPQDRQILHLELAVLDDQSRKIKTLLKAVAVSE